MLIPIKFKSDKEMKEWLDNKEDNIEKLKKKFNPKKYSATLNFKYKRIEIKEKP